MKVSQLLLDIKVLGSLGREWKEGVGEMAHMPSYKSRCGVRALPRHSSADLIPRYRTTSIDPKFGHLVSSSSSSPINPNLLHQKVLHPIHISIHVTHVGKTRTSNLNHIDKCSIIVIQERIIFDEIFDALL